MRLETKVAVACVLCACGNIFMVYKETQHLLNDYGDKPANLLLTAGLLGMHVALDVVKACPLNVNISVVFKYNAMWYISRMNIL